MTGYDLAFFIRKWLPEQKNQQHAGHSICEVILLDPRFAELRAEVGRARAFFSHVQQEGFLGGRMSRLSAEAKESMNSNHVAKKGVKIREICPEAAASTIGMLWEAVYGAHCPANHAHMGTEGHKENKLFWVDYFSLRQAQSDFKPEVVIKLVAALPEFVASVTREHGYLGRLFCVLELFAAVKAGKKLLVAHNLPSFLDEMERYCDKNVGSKNAQARSPKDKEKISGYIQQSVGFAHVDAVARKAFYEGCEFVDKAQETRRLKERQEIVDSLDCVCNALDYRDAMIESSELWKKMQAEWKAWEGWARIEGAGGEQCAGS